MTNSNNTITYMCIPNTYTGPLETRVALYSDSGKYTMPRSTIMSTNPLIVEYVDAEDIDQLNKEVIAEPAPPNLFEWFNEVYEDIPLEPYELDDALELSLDNDVLPESKKKFIEKYFNTTSPLGDNIVDLTEYFKVIKATR